jgi:hypothetical protein
MLLRLVAYCGLGVDCVVKGHMILAMICFGTPFAGPIGMWLAAVAGIWFFLIGLRAEGSVSIGVLLFNLIGNQWLRKRLGYKQ